MEDSSKLQVWYYDLTCTPEVLRPADADSVDLTPKQAQIVLKQLKTLEEQQGYVNVVVLEGDILMTPHSYMFHCNLQVLAVHPGWLLLAGGLVLAPPEFSAYVGTVLSIKSDSQGRAVAEKPTTATQGSKSLVELQALNAAYFPADGHQPVIDIGEYPVSIGAQRLRIEYLKLLKPYNAGFLSQVEELKKEFSSWRKVRGDGNCYYRAVGFVYLEHLCRSKVPSHFLRSFYMRLFLQQGPFSLSRLLSPDFDRDLYWVLSRLHELLTIKETRSADGCTQALEQLEYIYVHDSQFDLSLIRVLKLAAWNQLQDFLPNYTAFLPKPLPELLEEILTDGLESEGLVFQLMADVLDAVIMHVLLPPTGTVFTEQYCTGQKGRKAVLSLLLRPGHYDILYPLQADIVDKYNFVLEDYSGLAETDLGYLSQLYRDL